MPVRLQVLLGFYGDVARVSRVALERDRVVHEAVEVQGLVLAEGVEDSCRGVGDEKHVRLLDLLEAADGRPVEAESLREGGLGQLMGGHGEVLHEPGQVAKSDVDDLDLLVPRQLYDFCGGALAHVSSLVRPRGATYGRIERKRA